MAERAYDLLVVGSGAAGLSAALRAVDLDASARVGVLTAGALLAGSSPRAQGGVAAAVGADDAPALHAADTLAVGAGLNDADAVAVLTSEGSRSIQSLWDAGMRFEDDLGLEAGHARRRILHAGGGATGDVLTRALLERASRHPRITLYAHAPVWALQKTGQRVTGARVGRRVVPANAVVIATGGYAALWARTTNGPENRGGGVVMAWRAGASLADLEFVQFHPTALDLAGRPAFLLSEALRGEGARLLSADGQEVVDPLLPRDVVARALYRHLQRRGAQVFLSLRHLDAERVEARFGRLAATLREFGLELARDLLPVAPAAHYCMGGIRTDTWGRTDVAGLYAAGEVTCSGVQGANRLASNSLLECLVFGARAAEAALTDAAGTTATWHTRPLLPLEVGPAATTFAAIDARVLGDRLDADLAVERDPRRLAQLVAELPGPDLLAPGTPDPLAQVAANPLAAGTPDSRAPVAPDLLLASLIARGALLRAESRGAHFRIDAPQPRPAWRGRIHWRLAHPPTFEEVL
ncbi:MAG TPA: FAD-binding protein [Chloroflexota bacterium]|nr:FAD-binding protein [Chloroflexota bacterium]